VRESVSGAFACGDSRDDVRPKRRCVECKHFSLSLFSASFLSLFSLGESERLSVDLNACFFSFFLSFLSLYIFLSFTFKSNNHDSRNLTRSLRDVACIRFARRAWSNGRQNFRRKRWRRVPCVAKNFPRYRVSLKSTNSAKRSCARL